MIFLNACASGPSAQYQLTEENLRQDNRGIVIGNAQVNSTQRPALVLKEVRSGNELTIIGTYNEATPFAAALPAGDYQVISIGGRSANYEPVSAPITFIVQSNEVVCIGGIYDAVGLRLEGLHYNNEPKNSYGYKDLFGKWMEGSQTELVVINTCPDIKRQLETTKNINYFHSYIVRLAR